MDSAPIQKFLKEPIISVSALSGGDIAKAQKVSTNKATYFIKSASFPNAQRLFEEEAIGIQKIEETKTICTPKVLGVFKDNQTSYLVLEFIESKSPSSTDYVTFGRKLAQLHLAGSEESFGFINDNFIGKLAQINNQKNDWTTFFVLNRLLPQLKIALENSLISKVQLPSIDKMTTVCQSFMGNVIPSLLHGDLWSGNYLISKQGEPFLIDPAVYYGHNEVDIAMTRLFGGFSSDFYEGYHEVIPPHPNQKELTEIYQLYYLLVHLNLFGRSYLGSVFQILKKYFL